MDILFIHPNFPAQYRHIAAALARDPSNRIVFATQNERPEWTIPGVRKLLFGKPKPGKNGTHPFSRGFDTAVRMGIAALQSLQELAASGFRPAAVYGHSGWGTTLFLKDLFPHAVFIGYFEWFYNARGSDADFDPSEPLTWQTAATIRTRNAPILIDLAACDHGVTPTFWQLAQFPVELRSKLTVLHDGVDAAYFQPYPSARAGLPEPLNRAEELVTYATRGMEPYRGFPQFMEAVAALLKNRPKCHAAIAGEDRVCYGKRSACGSWKEEMLGRLNLDPTRVHFLGSLPYGRYKALLQASDVHIYLTRPFVLSWSLIEAMSCGCLVVGSDTPPLREVIRHGANGLLAPFFDTTRLAETIGSALDRREELKPLREAARKTVLARYSLQRLLPLHLELLGRLLATRRTSAEPQRPDRVADQGKE
jgi:glycosyltransferase involved in cell wall biosynthesis